MGAWPLNGGALRLSDRKPLWGTRYLHTTHNCLAVKLLQTTPQALIPHSNPWKPAPEEEWRPEVIIDVVMDENARLAHELKQVKEHIQNMHRQGPTATESRRPEEAAQHNSNRQTNQEQTASNKVHVSIHFEQAKSKVIDYSERCLVGLLFGPRPSMESMKAWIWDS